MTKHLRGALSPRDSHDAWMLYKLKDGWKYAPLKDAAAKTHPSLLPYAALSKEERAKDHVFGHICRAFINAGILIEETAAIGSVPE